MTLNLPLSNCLSYCYNLSFFHEGSLEAFHILVKCSWSQSLPKVPLIMSLLWCKIELLLQCMLYPAKAKPFPQLTEVEGLKNKWIREDQKKCIFIKRGKITFSWNAGKASSNSSLVSVCQTHYITFSKAIWTSGVRLKRVKSKTFKVCLIGFFVVFIDNILSPKKNQEHKQPFCCGKWLGDIAELWITKLVLIFTCVLSIGLDIKWMRLSKPEISIKTRQAYTESILPIPPEETLSNTPSWKISQALLVVLYHLNKGFWLALLVPHPCYTAQ